jgi:hypothetical protein
VTAASFGSRRPLTDARLSRLETEYPVDPNATYPVLDPPVPVLPSTGPPAYLEPPVYAPATVATGWAIGPGAPDFGGYPPLAGHPYPRSDERPGAVVAVLAMAYIVGAMLLMSGFLLFVAASATRSLDNAGSNDSGQLILAGVANMVTGGLLVFAGALISGRRAGGRAVLAAAAAICIVIASGWLAAAGTATLIWAVVFCTPVVVATGIAFGVRVSGWLAAGSSAP